MPATTHRCLDPGHHLDQTGQHTVPQPSSGFFFIEPSLVSRYEGPGDVQEDDEDGVPDRDLLAAGRLSFTDGASGSGLQSNLFQAVYGDPTLYWIASTQGSDKTRPLNCFREFV